MMYSERWNAIGPAPPLVAMWATDKLGRKTMEPNRAMKIMAEGYVCSKSVLLAVCQEFGIEVNEKVIPKSLWSSHGYSLRGVA